MKQPPKLKVLTAPGVLVPHHESQGRGGEKRVIGRTWSDEHHGYVANGEPIEVPTIPTSSPYYAEMYAEYVRELQQGSLLAADEATAKAAGVKVGVESKAADGETDVVFVARTPPGSRIQ
jgi:hypothetical protein